MYNLTANTTPNRSIDSIELKVPLSLKRKFEHLNLYKEEEDDEEEQVDREENGKINNDYLCRDFILWLLFLFLFPVVLFILIYLFTTFLTINKHNNNNNSNTNYSFDTNEILKLVNNSNESKSTTNNDENQRKFKRISLKGENAALCNDGSIASYYLRLSNDNNNSNNNNKSWIILLEGGYFCYNSLTCRQRLINSPHLMTTTTTKSRQHKNNFNGILSSSQKVNKYWHTANHVYVFFLLVYRPVYHGDIVGTLW